MKKKFQYLFYCILAVTGFTACSNVDDWTPKDTQNESILLSETLVNGLGNFTEYSVSGDQKWIGDVSYAIMSGYVNPTNYDNEDWLISPEIDLTKVTAASLSFQHVTRYFTNLAASATVWISSNYVSGDPNLATWTQLQTTPFVDYGSWDFVPSGDISLTPFVGKKVHIAFKYISTAAKAGTWEIMNVVVKNTEAVVVTKNFGKGTEDSPYTIEGAVYNQSSSAWVTGYIVGYISVGTPNKYVFNSDTCTQSTNLLLADSLNSMYISKALPVQLPAGAVRTGLNLKDNKANIGKKVTLYGDLASYFSVPGLKNVIYYKLEDGTTGGTKPVFPIYSESFISRQGDFTVDNKILPAGFTSIWNASSYGITASGFKSANYASESWLISPSFDLTGYTSIGMSFDHTINKGLLANLTTDHTLWISIDNGTTWTQLTIPNYPAGNNWTFVNSGDIDLNPYIGKTIKVAFKYISSTASSASWEIKNFQVYKRQQ